MDELKRLLLDRGAALVRFADLAIVPAEDRQDLRYGVCIGFRLDPAIIADISKGPTKDYHGEYCRVNAALNLLGESAAGFLRNQGHRAIALAATLERIDPKTLCTRLPHKTVATRAGVGWIGKCALLITEEFGSAIRFSTVLTDAPLTGGQRGQAGQPGRQVDESRCGDCTACVEACPGRAPSGRNWQLGAARSDFFDAFACHKTAKGLSAAAGIDGTICGICIAACPWTQRYLRRAGL